jgi:hypothetical protein
MRDMLVKEIEELSKAKKMEATNLVAQALKIGITKLWQEMVLDRYLRKKISRREAIKLAGVDFVRLAEKQKKIVLEDVRWGLRHV